MFFIIEAGVPLGNAVQSSTHNRFNCVNNNCAADKAIDKDMSTYSLTLMATQNDWWSVELLVEAAIDQINAYLSQNDLRQGKFNQFQVTSRRSNTEDWSICKEKYSVTEPVNPHVLRCERPTIAKYLRLNVFGGNYLAIMELVVLGSTLGQLLLT